MSKRHPKKRTVLFLAALLLPAGITVPAREVNERYQTVNPALWCDDA